MPRREGSDDVNFHKDENTFTEEVFLQKLSQYRKTGSNAIRNELVMNFAYIPQTAAIQLRGLASGYAQVDDMVNQGIITLMDCIDHFDEEKGITFEYYAFMRVRGAIIDLVRKQDWVPRRVREQDKKINQVKNDLANELMREPTDKELAERLGVSEEKLSGMLAEVNGSTVLSFEELIQNMSQMGTSLEAEGMSPEKQLLSDELKSVLANAIDSLGERERLVVSLYYYENLTFADIAQVLEVSVQRASQINAKAVSKLKTAMEEYLYG
ncbi:MAG: FliA/WhiG family RNA polymerase sigma factor [Ruminococcus sp.]|nr:FliA/WhiG family RNA polymerase sigma factor [Ruminococcus sp.]